MLSAKGILMEFDRFEGINPLQTIIGAILRPLLKVVQRVIVIGT
jgi:hypothetical protein